MGKKEGYQLFAGNNFLIDKKYILHFDSIYPRQDFFKPKQLPDVFYGYGNNQTDGQQDKENQIGVLETIDEIRPVIGENKCMEQKYIEQVMTHKSQRPLYKRIRLRDFKNE